MAQGTIVIEVGYKAGETDPQAVGLSHDVRQMGFASVKRVATSQLYRLVGNVTPEDRKRAERDLLCDPVIQECRDGEVEDAPRMAVIDVWYKPGVTDVIGESVLKGLRDLNLSGVDEVRTGMRYRMWGLQDAAAADKLARALLSNPLVHDHIIHDN